MAASETVGGRSGRGGGGSGDGVGHVVSMVVLVPVVVVPFIILCRVLRLPHGACVNCSCSRSHPCSARGSSSPVLRKGACLSPSQLVDETTPRETSTFASPILIALLHHSPLGSCSRYRIFP